MTVLVGTSIRLVVSPSPAIVGQLVTFTIIASPLDASGLVTVVVDSVVLCIVDLLSGSGNCTYTFDDLVAGSTKTITASYVGDATHASTSATTTLIIEPAVTPCGPPVPSQPTWVCQNGHWTAMGDQNISADRTDLMVPVVIIGNLNVTNPDAVIVTHFDGRPVLNITGTVPTISLLHLTTNLAVSNQVPPLFRAHL